MSSVRFWSVPRKAVAPGDQQADLPAKSEARAREMLSDYNVRSKFVQEGIRAGHVFKPDLRVERAGRTLVLDTKWKGLSGLSELSEAKADRPRAPDRYRPYRYLCLYCERATLRYPTHATQGKVNRGDIVAQRSMRDEMAGTLAVRFVDGCSPLWAHAGSADLAKALVDINSESLGLSGPQRVQATA